LQIPKYFKQVEELLFSFIECSDVRQTEIQAAEPLVPGLSHLEVESALAKLKKYKSPGSDQIPPRTDSSKQ
jgi:hypothetical protein